MYKIIALLSIILICSFGTKCLGQTLDNESLIKEKGLSDFREVQQVHVISNDYIKYLDTLKSKMANAISLENPLDKKNSSHYIDSLFFNKKKYAASGRDFLIQMKIYEESLLHIIDNDSIKLDLRKKFNIRSVKNKKGKKINWLVYNFKGFPLIATLTKITQIQSDVYYIEKKYINSFSKSND